MCEYWIPGGVSEDDIIAELELTFDGFRSDADASIGHGVFDCREGAVDVERHRARIALDVLRARPIRADVVVLHDAGRVGRAEIGGPDRLPG